MGHNNDATVFDSSKFKQVSFFLKLLQLFTINKGIGRKFIKFAGSG
jgi:hypothetical protein